MYSTKQMSSRAEVLIAECLTAAAGECTQGSQQQEATEEELSPQKALKLISETIGVSCTDPEEVVREVAARFLKE